MAVGLMWFIQLTGDSDNLNLLAYLFSGILMVLTTGLVLKIFHFAIYEGKNPFLNWGRKRPALFTTLLFLIFVGTQVVIQLFTPAIWIWHLEFPQNIFFLTVVGCIFLGLLFKILGKNSTPFALLVAIYLISNIVTSLPSTLSFFQQTVVGSLLKNYGPLFCYLIYLFYLTRKEKKERL